MFNAFKEQFNILKEDIIKPDICCFYVEAKDIREVLKFLKEDSRFLFERLDCIEGEDGCLTYLLHSDKYNCKCAVCCEIKNNEIESVYDIFKSANFDEREIFDLFGVQILNHPNLKRILLPDSFIGHPLRKDYVSNDERLAWNND